MTDYEPYNPLKPTEIRLEDVPVAYLMASLIERGRMKSPSFQDLYDTLKVHPNANIQRVTNIWIGPAPQGSNKARVGEVEEYRTIAITGHIFDYLKQARDMKSTLVLVCPFAKKEILSKASQVVKNLNDVPYSLVESVLCSKLNSTLLSVKDEMLTLASLLGHICVVQPTDDLDLILNTLREGWIHLSENSPQRRITKKEEASLLLEEGTLSLEFIAFHPKGKDLRTIGMVPLKADVIQCDRSNDAYVAMVHQEVVYRLLNNTASPLDLINYLKREARYNPSVLIEKCNQNLLRFGSEDDRTKAKQLIKNMDGNFKAKKFRPVDVSPQGMNFKMLEKPDPTIPVELCKEDSEFGDVLLDHNVAKTSL